LPTIVPVAARATGERLRLLRGRGARRLCLPALPARRETATPPWSPRSPTPAPARRCSRRRPALDLAELARVAGYGKAHFHRAFRQRTGLTPRGYAEAARYRRLRDALAAGAPVLGAIADAGFSSPSRAYAAAARQLGTTPAAFRDRVRADGIRYATRATTLGWVLLAATPDGVCAVVLGDSRRALEDEFERGSRRRKAARPGSPPAAPCRRFVADPATPLQLPLDVAGTAFQHRVWRALLALPPGTTTSYGALAATLGAPRAVRAVAGACAANPAALVIPCHRVVAKDGGMAGYRWGVERKARLQERERAATAGAGGPGGKASQRAGR
jgi:AraC family transcriptional regulator of adaptative response/methylated-DNA-[protein]-cysteine methyltransferase